MASVKLPTSAFVIVWVTSAYFMGPRRFRSGKDIYLLTCLPSELEAVCDTFSKHRLIFSDDQAEALEVAGDIAKRLQRHKVFTQDTTYLQVATAAA
jgi:hypothetical protein